MTPGAECFSQSRWLSVYGAMVALQVRDHMDAGKGPPDGDVMERFAEEAAAVADNDEAANDRLWI